MNERSAKKSWQTVRRILASSRRRDRVDSGPFWDRGVPLTPLLPAGAAALLRIRLEYSILRNTRGIHQDTSGYAQNTIS